MMSLLFVLNIIASPLLACFVPLYFTRYFKLGGINLLTINLVIGLPIVLLSTFAGPAYFLPRGLFNPYFQYALLVDNVHSLLGSLSMIWIVRQLLRHPHAARWMERVAQMGAPVRSQRMRLAAILFLGLFIICFVLLAQSSFGLLNWLASPRTGYQNHRSGAGQWYALALTFLSVSIVLAMTYARTNYHVLALAPVYLFGSYLLGSKGIVLTFTAFIIIILQIRQYRYFKPLAVLFLVVGTALMAYNFVAAMGEIGVEEIAQYADYFVNAAKYYQLHLNGGLPLYYGDITLSSFWGLVPRGLYPNKPYVYGVIKVIEVFYPGGAEATNTPAFATIDYYADFGWLGVLLSGLFGSTNIMNAVLYALILPRLKTFDYRNRIEHHSVLLFALLLLIAPMFLFYFGFPIHIIMFLIIVKTIDAVNRLRIVPPTTARLATTAGASEVKTEP
jgi:hypothetical protein